MTNDHNILLISSPVWRGIHCEIQTTNKKILAKQYISNTLNYYIQFFHERMEYSTKKVSQCPLQIHEVVKLYHHSKQTLQ